MTRLYQLIDRLLPFSWLSHDFMKDALLALLVLTPVLGLLGTIVVETRLAFFSDALGHSALTGIALGALLGITRPTISMVLFAVIFAYLLNLIRRSNAVSGDTVISVFSSTAIALGLVALSRSGSFSKFSSYLIGDILTVEHGDLGILAVVGIAVPVYWLLCFNQLLLISVSPLLASSKGVPVKLVQTVFMMVLAVIVMVSIRWVGVLMINSLLILPAAAARNISRNMRSFHLIAVLLALSSGIAGLALSYYLNSATGPTIALCGAVMFFATYVLRGKVKT